eukprot:c46341_g1_i1 orf=165-437(+)
MVISLKARIRATMAGYNHINIAVQIGLCNCSRLTNGIMQVLCKGSQNVGNTPLVFLEDLGFSLLLLETYAHVLEDHLIVRASKRLIDGAI